MASQVKRLKSYLKHNVAGNGRTGAFVQALDALPCEQAEYCARFVTALADTTHNLGILGAIELTVAMMEKTDWKKPCPPTC